jgi:hypothetical protein
MYDYSRQIDSFHDEKVVLSKSLSDRLVAHRTANENRLVSRLSQLKKGVRVSSSSFKSQGSFAMKTIIQTKFDDEEYDIDDGLVLWRADLTDKDGGDMTPAATRDLVRVALKDPRFKRQPQAKKNCVRVFYAEEDEEKHHVDFPVYRKWQDSEGEDSPIRRQLAGETDWIDSDPTRVNVWFEEHITSLNAEREGAGTLLRRCIRLLKRFCRSRSDWNMPNGLKLTMLAVECFRSADRVDVAFRELLRSLDRRQRVNLEVENLADESFPKAKLTKSTADSNMVELRDRASEALGKLEVLDASDCDRAAARAAWDWVFKTDGYFADHDGAGGDDGNSRSKAIDRGIAAAAPTRPVDPHGGGRYG